MSAMPSISGSWSEFWAQRRGTKGWWVFQASPPLPPLVTPCPHQSWACKPPRRILPSPQACKMNFPMEIMFPAMMGMAWGNYKGKGAGQVYHPQQAPVSRWTRRNQTRRLWEKICHHPSPLSLPSLTRLRRSLACWLLVRQGDKERKVSPPKLGPQRWSRS